MFVFCDFFIEFNLNNIRLSVNDLKGSKVQYLCLFLLWGNIMAVGMGTRGATVTSR